MKPLCFFLILFLTLNDPFSALAGESDFSLSEEWLNLLHYQKITRSKFEGRIDSAAFYLAPAGKANPQDELIASLSKLRSAYKENDLRLLCLYPARYKVLHRHFPEQLPEFDFAQRCSDLGKFVKALNAQSVSLIFSSYYLNNPSSSFGHTFLRINKPGSANGQRHELLDYGINYAATINTDNALVYAFKGLFGYFPGQFTSVPYYLKVREYSNSESRDLWEYELSLTPEEIDLLVYHLWEVGQYSADYWYLTENCSYFVLAVLDAVAPRLTSTKRLKKYVIPSDTVTLVAQTPGLVKKIRYRPAIRSEFYARAYALDQSERKVFLDIFRNHDYQGLSSLSDDSKVKVLDTAMDAVDFKYFDKLQDSKSPEFAKKAEVLSQRAQLPRKSEVLNVSPNRFEKPHEAHGSRRLYVGGEALSEDKKTDFVIAYRFALHEFLDPRSGYPQASEISFADMAIRKNDQDFRLDHLYIFKVRSLQPVDFIFWNPSWFFELGMENLNLDTCNLCESFISRGGAGFTFYVNSENFVSFLIWAEGLYSFRSESSIRSQANIAGKIIYRSFLADAVNGIFELDQIYKSNEDQFVLDAKIAIQRNFGDKWGLRFFVAREREEQRLGIGLLNYH